MLDLCCSILITGKNMPQLELKIPPLLLVLLFAAAMSLLSSAVPQLSVPLPGNTLLSIVLLVLGGVTALFGVLAFHRANTTVDPRNPQKSATLVVKGIYRVSRNPMYLGFLLSLLALACYLTNLAAFVCAFLFVVYMNRFQIEPEERWMAEKFSEHYQAYCTRVRRWL